MQSDECQLTRCLAAGYKLVSCTGFPTLLTAGSLTQAAPPVRSITDPSTCHVYLTIREQLSFPQESTVETPLLCGRQEGGYRLLLCRAWELPLRSSALRLLLPRLCSVSCHQLLLPRVLLLRRGSSLGEGMTLFQVSQCLPPALLATAWT